MEKTSTRPGVTTRKRGIAAVNFLSEADRRNLIFNYNDTDADYPKDVTIVELFDRQALSAPNNVAFVSGDRSVSYGELKALSEKIASYLSEVQGVAAGDLVGLMLDRDEWLIPCIFGVLKSGAAYAPIDPAYPEERVRSIIANAGMRVLITRDEYQSLANPDDITIVNLDSSLPAITDFPAGAQPVFDSSQLAYVIHTSGSTGVPKGVMIEHRSLVNYIWWAAAHYFGNAKATFPLYSSISFDLTVTSIFAPLITGNRVIVYSDKDSDILVEKLLTDDLCDIIKLTPSHLKIVRDSDLIDGIAGKRLIKFIVGGENLETRLAMDIYEKFQGKVVIYNEYGPTEATVGCMIYAFDPASKSFAVPIGTPIANTRIYILDNQLNPVANGITGEIFIAGDGLARGYWRRPDLTDERFVPDPFIPGALMYKTGDQAKRQTDGNIIYLGRIDQQVKINGHRIELGEIEFQLSAHPGIKESVVVARETNDQQSLVAYFISDSSLSGTELKTWLEAKLPAFMVPAQFARIDQIPLTSNGKLDRKALPDPDPVAGEPYQAPVGPTENALVDIWSRVLNIEKENIGVKHRFSDLGGHSIKMMSMAGKVFKELQVKIPIKELFQFPDISSLGAYIDGLRKEAGEGNTGNGADLQLKKATTADYYPLSSAQKRLYFLHRFDPLGVAYNMPKMLRLKGTVDQERLQAAFSGLVQRHESLRTSFVLVNGEPMMQISPDADWEFSYRRGTVAELDSIIAEFIAPFDLAKAPLLRVGLVQIAADDHLLMIDKHHIISDGVSEGILTTDFMALYNNEMLAPLAFQYKDYSEWQAGDAQRALLAAKKDYWLKELSGELPMLPLPTDFVRPAIKGQSGDVVRLKLDAATISQLRLLAAKEDATIFMVLLAVYSVLLSKLSGQDDVIIGTPVAGRTNPDLEKILGVFINILCLRNVTNGEAEFTAFLAGVKRKLIDALQNQEYPYEELIEALRTERSTGHNPLFDVAFAYQNMDGDELRIPGLILTQHPRAKRAAKLDLSLEAVESKDGILLNFEYSTDLFKRSTMERFAGYFEQILSTVCSDPRQKLADIDMLSANERQWLLSTCNDTACAYPDDENIVSLFEQQVRNNPGKTAVVFEGQSYTYTELNAQANKVAHHLRSHCGVKPNQLVALIAERSERMLICLLGILKSGAAYLPVDPTYPDDRKVYMLEDSQAQVLLLCDSAAPASGFGGTIVRFDELSQSHDENPEPINSPADLCYVIYTSGSTGKPKGVMISHYNVVNFMTGISRNIGVSATDRLLAVTGTSFDISVLELFWTLCNGISTVIHPGGISLSHLDRYVPGDMKTLDFSLFFFSSYNNSENDKYRLLLDSVKYADQAGFKAVWTPERHFHEFGGLYPNPSVVSAALAMITKNIELRSGSVVSPLHDVIRIAEEWSVVDNLSNGRIGLSFAPGWNANDFALASESFAGRQDKMREQIDELRSMWSGKKIKRINGNGQEVELRIFPVPIQKELPLWITSSGNAATFKNAGASGAHVLTHLLGQDINDLAEKIKLYRSAREANGYDAASGKVTVMLHTFIGENAEEVEQLAEGPFVDYLKSAIGLNKIVFEETGLDIAGIPEAEMARILKNAFKRYYTTSSLIGTKDKCSELVHRLKEMGVDEIACLIDFGVEEKTVLDGLKNLKAVKDLFSVTNSTANTPVSMLQSTPSFIKAALAGAGSEDFLRQLRVLMLGGEELPMSLLEKLRGATGADIYNMYGPTETTIWSSMHRIEADPSFISVGKPIANTQLYILDKHLQLAPTGVAGSLFIGGEGLSRGYWRRPELTAERFIDSPFIPGSKIYRTGDLARWNSNGTVELIGREDKQVKIRGHRIELGEIEAKLSSREDIQESVVICIQQEEEKFLAAYYVSDEKIAGESLRKWLGEQLPDYMVPAYFLQLAAMPLTHNGKIDRKLLPNPRHIASEDYVAPAGEMQEAAVTVWSEVLKMDAGLISVRKSFFELGGNSLNAISMINKMNERFDLRIPINEVFNKLNIEGIVEYIAARRQAGEKGQSFHRIPQAGSKDFYRLSSAQKRLYFLHEFDPTSLAYNAPRIMTVKGTIDQDRLKTVFNQLVSRHESLRTSFDLVGQEPVQLIAPTAGLSIEFVAADRQETDQLIRQFIRPFDLSQGPLLRVGLIGFAPDEHILMIDMHHIITDGVSNDVLITDFMRLYNGETLAPTRLQYKDYAEWQQGERQQQELARQKDFWLNMFSEEVAGLELPADHARPAVQDPTGGAVSFRLGAAETAKLKELAQKEGVTLFMLLLGIYNVLIGKLANQEDVTIGVPVAGRNHTDLERIMGMFVNTLPVRNYPKVDQSFSAFLAGLRTTLLNCFENQDYPYEELIDELKVRRDLSHNPLFDVAFVYQNFETPELKIPGLKLTPSAGMPPIAQFDLQLTIFETKAGLDLRFDYATALFGKGSIHRFVRFFEKITAAVVADVSIRLADIDLSSAAETDQLLYDFNNTKVDYPAEKTIIDLFEEQVENQQDKVAIWGDGVTITYRELKERSDQMAIYLQEVMGVKPGDLVGILLEREAYLIPAIFGVLKAGAAYIPLDPNYPADRINSILADSGMKVLISRRGLLHAGLAKTEGLVDLDACTADIERNNPASLSGQPDSKNPAYVIYTSGSTGKPKGVMIEHHSVVNRLLWMQKAYPIGAKDTILFKTSISFDVSVWEIFWWAITGASVCLLKPGGEKDPQVMVDTIEKAGVTTMHFVPSMLSIFLGALPDNHLSRLKTLRQVFSSGEALKLSHVQAFGKTLHQNNGTTLINLYGPTEATVDVSHYRCTFSEDGMTIPIGKPIDNTRLYVVAKGGGLSPVGVTGELCIGGVQLARGYLNNPALTNEKFVTAAFGSKERIYRTGDLVRRLPDGDIEYLGRIDHQVKVRGFRIELNEIEFHLATHPGVQEAVVVTKGEDEDKFLAAYYVSAGELDGEVLRNHLLARLPEYMVPSFFKRIDRIPLSVNGKLEKRALPEPDRTPAGEIRAAENELQEQLLNAWRQVLGINTLSINADFFSVGGNSLKLIKLYRIIQDSIPYKIEVRNLFEHRTIIGLSTFIENKYALRQEETNTKKYIIEF